MRGPIVYEAPRPAAAPGETVVTSTCGHNCGGRCVVNAHVRDGRIVRISSDPRKWTPELPPLHACVRGFGQAERRQSPRSAALPAAAGRARAAGDASSGSPGTRRSTRSPARCGGSATPTAPPRSWTARAPAALHAAQPRHRRAPAQHVRRLHRAVDATSRRRLRSSRSTRPTGPRPTTRARAASRSTTSTRKLIVMWGWSPADGTFGTSTLQYLKRAKQAGVKIICVNPRRTSLERGWPTSTFHPPAHRHRRAARDGLRHRQRGPAGPGLPGSPRARLRQAHLPPDAPAGADFRATSRARPTACRRRRAGRPRSPACRPRRSCALAVEYATSKPAALQTGYAPGRTLHGEQFHRAAYALCGDDRQHRHPRRQRGHQQRRDRARRMGRLPTGANPIGARGHRRLLADLLLTRQGRRLPGRHQDGLLGPRRPLQPDRQRAADHRGRASGSSSWWSTTSS